MTGLTEPAFMALLPPFAHALVAYMRDHTMEGQPRASRHDRTYDHCPVPTMADKLLFILTYLQQNPIQEVQGQLLGLSQSNATKWLHLLYTTLTLAFAHQDLLPARTADAFATLLATTQTKDAPTSPLFGRMVPNARAIARPIQKTSRNTLVARRRATRSTTAS
jgi:hypothetical protein